MALVIVKKVPKNQGKPLKVIISKGAVKSAVGRNLLKRRIRAIMRPATAEPEDAFIVIARPGAADLSYDELRKELIREVEKR
jgi:ribonuclease P protein component